jgi:hypothetical protein
MSPSSYGGRRNGTRTAAHPKPAFDQESASLRAGFTAPLISPTDDQMVYTPGFLAVRLTVFLR